MIILKDWQNKSKIILIIDRFIQSAKKQTPNSSSKEINSLFYEIAGFKATHITNKDINNW